MGKPLQAGTRSTPLTVEEPRHWKLGAAEGWPWEHSRLLVRATRVALGWTAVVTASPKSFSTMAHIHNFFGNWHGFLRQPWTNGFGRKALKMGRGARCFLAQAVWEQCQGNLTCFPACCCHAGSKDVAVCCCTQQGLPGARLPSAAKCRCRLSAGSVRLQPELDFPFVFTWQNFSHKIEKTPLVAQAIVWREWNPLPPFPSSPW